MPVFKTPLKLTFEEVLPFLKIDKNPSPMEEELIHHYLRKIKLIAQPIGIYDTFFINEQTPTKINLKTVPLIITGPLTVQYFYSCSQITLLATTLGPDLDDFLTNLSAARALIADAVASAAIESFTEQLDQHLTTLIKRKGYYPTIRLSPGYGDWPLQAQKAFLASLKTETIGLTLTSHYLLQPRKSITAVLGWSNIPVKRTYLNCTRNCATCPQASTCQLRINPLDLT